MSDEIDDDEVEVIATYDMDEDAMGLGDFIVTTFKDIPDHLIVVDVSDEQYRPAKSVRFERDDLGIHLIIEFDRTIIG